jgi:hypothetical protein
MVKGMGMTRDVVTRKAPTGLFNPKQELYLVISGEAKFGVLSVEDCTVLQGHPHHMFLQHLRHHFIMD